MAKVKKIHGREILDSRGTPTVEVEVTFDSGHMGRFAVPSGASTGAYEAHELRDKDPKRHFGKGVRIAVENINNILSKKLVGEKFVSVEAFDNLLLNIDGTENKSKIGANAILGVSVAAAKAAALGENLAFYRYLGGAGATKLPVPLMNVVNGGAHANNGVDVQEFMIVPVVGESFSESLRAGCEIFHSLKKIINEKGMTTAVGDEGGFAPKLSRNQDALQLIMKAIEKAGYKPGQEVFLALDVAATEMYNNGQYSWEGRSISSEELADIYKSWMKEYPLVSIEDGFSEDDWDGWIRFTKSVGEEIQLVGDDLFVTNPKRLQEGISRGAANALLVKVNQIGTLSETIKAVKMAQQASYRTVMSHRSGETEDATIADLAVGLETEQIKTGSLCRGERTAKYNQLLRIEEDLGSKAKYWGSQAFHA